MPQINYRVRCSNEVIFESGNRSEAITSARKHEKENADHAVIVERVEIVWEGRNG